MDLRRLFQKRPKALDHADDGFGEDDDDTAPLGDAMAANDAARRKQMLLLGGAGAGALIIGSLYIFDDGPGKGEGELAEAVEGVSVDEMVNKNMAEKEWRAQSEAQMMSMDTNMRALAARAERADQLEAQLAREQGGSVSPETERVLSAYQAENEQLRAALAAARQSPVGGNAGPTSLYGRTSPPGYQVAGSPRGNAGSATPAGQAAAAAAGLQGRSSEVALVSFGEGAVSSNGSPVPKGNTVYTDSANYLPPNSIALARVIVGVDANAGVQSQTDPLPVVLRITGPARSVYDNGRLLTTNISGCLVNGAARGDLSSEKVYVKLQRMTCPQPNGRYAVSEVKGFIAFGGKTGVRGRVVSREGALVGQAFLAGLAGGFGRGFSANTSSILTGTNVTVDGKRQRLGTGEILEGGLGEGVATSADMVSKYLIERAEQYQPVIEMPTGIDVEIVFLEGVFING
ncbi:TraB/VirB10 family protein [Novosphingobium pentaromativorans]|uniref:Sex pilus assembly and synthesis protein n=1 Tax=Novosphingobium pentaromativorans US6-1 TaxID=1088721 RepID=G6ELB8_9SPHN|nr:TraB/VirB10 family protein [Novosphingobium pentaromativorans]AIT82697.1 conjugal transfer protein TraB [Novosphingobium pentaromativorans US6-1]EHJ58085.1 sex pilus assembly and synthesis protein [Novosphingobium pentaromativorans US6-1]